MLEQIRWSTIDLGGSIDALHAKHTFRFSFEPHRHEEFAVGLIDSGVVQRHHDGKTAHIATDKVAIATPVLCSILARRTVGIGLPEADRRWFQHSW